MAKIHVKAPGKLILMGEYAVLEGGKAMVVALDAYSHISLGLRDNSSSLFHAPQIGFDHAPFDWVGGKMVFSSDIDESLKAKLILVETVLTYFYEKFEAQFENSGIDLVINTEEFFSRQANCKLGLGSSASVCVSLVAAFLAFLQQETAVDLNDVFTLAFRLHRDAQGGVGSGIDIAASTYGGYLEFSPDGNDGCLPSVDSMKEPDELCILPIFTGESAGTVDLVNEVYLFRDEHKEHYDRLLENLRELSAAGVRSFREGDFQTFLATITDYSKGLGKLGDACGAPIISAIHQRANQAVIELGGIYKISGAGGGDFGLAFFRDKDATENAKRCLELDGWEIPSFRFGCEGVQVFAKG